MTGTALENKVDEMISLIEILRPNLAHQISNIAFMSTAPQFREKVASVYYRRKRVFRAFGGKILENSVLQLSAGCDQRK